MSKVYNVLVLCTGNSARSVMAEGLINVMGKGRFKAYSAGSKPSGKVNPLAIEQLQSIGYASETCPFWPGVPMTAHWGFADPGVSGTEEERRADFAKIFRQIMNRVHLFVNLPLEALEVNAIHHEVKQIGHVVGEATPQVQNEFIQTEGK